MRVTRFIELSACQLKQFERGRASCAPVLQKGFNILSRPAHHGPISAFDDRPLDEVRMFHHQRDEFIVAEIFLAQTKLTRDGLTRSQNLSRPEAHFPEQLAELLFAERLEIIIDLFEVNATLTEQLVQ